MRFTDEITIHLRSGKGGDGIVSFKHGKNQTKIGPDGGNGGHGGHLYIRCNTQLNTLGHLLNTREYHAEDGKNGGRQGSTGAVGKDLMIDVPAGTTIQDISKKEFLGELLNHHDKIRILDGGKRGYGNKHFASSTNQSPRENTKGTVGYSCKIYLKLKLFSDAAFVGLPNTGKSSLFGNITSAEPKIAHYPFTTSFPSLGVTIITEDYANKWRDSMVLMDTPSLMIGAHKGKGMGNNFLKHLERTQLILYVIDAPEFLINDHQGNMFFQIEKELKIFQTTLLKKKRWILFNKTDLIQTKSIAKLNEKIRVLHRKTGLSTFKVSKTKPEDLAKLKYQIYLSIKNKQ